MLTVRSEFQRSGPIPALITLAFLACAPDANEDSSARSATRAPVGGAFDQEQRLVPFDRREQAPRDPYLLTSREPHLILLSTSRERPARVPPPPRRARCPARQHRPPDPQGTLAR